MAAKNLTAERLREVLHYDPQTGDFTRRIAGGPAKAGDRCASISSYGYVVISVDGCSYLGHRLAWLYIHGEFPPQFIDHLNGIRTDNRIENLRLADRTINSQNRRAGRGSSGYLGVVKHRRLYRAQITVQGKCITLGSASTPEDAHAIYLAAKRRLHEGNTL